MYFSTIILVLIFIALYYYRFNKYPPNYPRGPWGIPYLGYLPFIGSHICSTFISLAKKYGDIYSLKLGEVDVVIVNGWDNMAEVQKKDDFVEFPKIKAFELFSGVDEEGKFLGLISADYEYWKASRNFYLRFMKRDEFTRENLEDYINDKIRSLCETLDGEITGDELVSRLHIQFIKTAHDHYIAKDFFTEEEIRKCSKFIRHQISSDKDFSNYVFFPAFCKLMEMVGRDVFSTLKATLNGVIDLIKKRLEEVKKDEQFMNGDSCLSNYLQMLNSLENDEEKRYLREDSLISSLYGIIFASGLSASTISHWVIIYLSQNPDALKRIQKEMEDAFGNGPPTISGKASAPFFESFIDEVMRIQPLVPIAMRSSRKDTTLGGYTIPKNTCIIMNLWETMRSERYWNKPEEFKPDRFLDDNDRENFNKRSMIFGMGKRRCIAENIGRLEIFLTVSNILQRFDVQADKIEIKRRADKDTLSLPDNYIFHFKRKSS